MCTTRVISHKVSAMIHRCAECRSIFIWNNNLILSFNAKQFAEFKQGAAELDFNVDAFPFPDSVDRVVMRTPLKDVQLTFTNEEWQDFNAAMDEALYMMEVYSLMEGERR